MMYLAAAPAEVDLVNIDFLNATLIAVLGYAVVFFGLILLMGVLVLLGRFFVAQEKRAKAKENSAAKAMAKPVPAPVAAAAPAAQAEAEAAPGTAGQLKLHDVPPKTAAMLMAIVANKLGKPLNELRFISIKEVK